MIPTRTDYESSVTHLEEIKFFRHQTSQRVGSSYDVVNATSQLELPRKQPLDHTPRLTQELSKESRVHPTDFGKSTLSNARSGPDFVKRYAKQVVS